MRLTIFMLIFLAITAACTQTRQPDHQTTVSSQKTSEDLLKDELIKKTDAVIDTVRIYNGTWNKTNVTFARVEFYPPPYASIEDKLQYFVDIIYGVLETDFKIDVVRVTDVDFNLRSGKEYVFEADRATALKVDRTDQTAEEILNNFELKIYTES